MMNEQPNQFCLCSILEEDNRVVSEVAVLAGVAAAVAVIAAAFAGEIVPAGAVVRAVAARVAHAGEGVVEEGAVKVRPAPKPTGQIRRLIPMGSTRRLVTVPFPPPETAETTAHTLAAGLRSRSIETHRLVAGAVLVLVLNKKGEFGELEKER